MHDIIWASDLSGVTWRKSAHSNSQGNCVEVAEAEVDGSRHWAVRDSKNPQGPALLFTEGEWAAFIGGVKDGEFDL